MIEKPYLNEDLFNIISLDYINIGMRVRKQRELLGMSKDDIACFLDVSAKFVYNIEIGARGMSLNTLAKLSQVLHISTDYILFGEKEKTDINPLLASFASCPAEKAEYAEELLKLFIKAIT
ncbi:MAG: helix-turn-helix domain-containing protein [Oscillospiraceae bacterium]|nr:helix-turn-helix domain-containing protein [Oscillospiraceae bacterium]